MNLIKSIFRRLYKYKLYSTINLFGLILGFTCSFAMILYAGFELSFDKFHADKENIYRINEVFINPEKKETNPMVRIPVGPDMQNEFPEIEDFTRITNRGWKKQLYRGEKEISISKALVADENFFDFFSFELLQGNPKNALKDNSSIVLTKKISEQLFGNTNPVGQTITCNDKSYTVTGVAENPPLNSHIQFDVVFPLLPVINSPDVNISWRGGMTASTFVKLNKNSTKSVIETKLPDFLWEKINKDSGKGFETVFYLEPLEKVHLFSGVDWDIFDRKEAKNVLTLLVIGCFVFIVALINYLFISNATISVRLQEFNIRKFLGIGKYGVMKLIFTETLILLFISGIVSAVLLILFNPTISQLFGNDFIKFRLYKTLPFLIIFIIITGLLISLIQFIFFKSSINSASVSSSNKPITRNKKLAYISAFQFCISIALIASMITVYKQLHFALNKDLGFSSHNIINISHGSIGGKRDVLIDEFRKIPGVLNASSSFGIPGLESTQNGYRPEGTDQWHMFNALYIDKNFFDTYQIQIIAGRNFDEIRNTNNKPCIVNETLAKKMNWDNPVGKYLYRDGNYEIIGVAQDFHVSSMFYEIPPLVISQEYQDNFYTLSVSISTENLPYTLKEIENKWTEINPNVPFTYSFLDDLFGRLYRDVQKTGKLLLIFTGMSVLISVLGLFGITFLMLNARIKEIGIRKINGAKISDIVTMLNAAFIKWVIAAFIIATPISWFIMQKWLDNFAYKTNLSWWIYTLSGMAALGIALLTVSLQSWRAASRNPVETLRYE